MLLAVFISFASGHTDACVIAGGVVASAPPLSMQPTNPWFDALKPGTFLDLHSKNIKIELGDMQKLADNINEQVKTWKPPIVTGHPEVASPRYGSIKGARIENGILQLCAADLSPTFVDSIRRGEYTDRSLSFFYPDMTMRHIGFLGAHKPAVTGLGPVSFGEGEFAEVDAGKDSSAIVFAEGPADISSLAMAQDNLASRLRWKFENVRDLFRKVRDHMIDKEGLDKANAMLPQNMIDDVDLGNVPSVSFSSPAPQSAAPAAVTAPVDPARTELEQQLEAAQEGRRVAEEALLKQKTDQRHAEFAELCSSHVKAGRLTPAMRVPLEALFKAADSVNGAISFGEGEPKDTLKVMESLLQSMPKVINLGADDPPQPIPASNARVVSQKITARADSENISTSAAYTQLKQEGAI